MITLEQAKKIIKDQVKILKEEKVCLNDSLFRILSEKIVSDRDYPPFDKAQMDGLACKQNDRKKKLKIIEEIPAGKIPQKIINSGECAKIMTGAVMPEGADCVIMVEQAEFLNENEVIFKGNDTEKYCYKKGSDLKRGDTVLTLGEKITSQHIAILSSVGITEVPVFKKPNVAVITSGNEIVNAGISPQTEQIRDCNSPMLLAQLNKLGISGRFYGIARDEYDSMKELTLKALDDDNQVIIFSAAMSMGDYDFGPRLFKDIGADIKFEKIAFQPGKPTVFAVCNG
ncbi:MAG: molybdopterin molybdotransferase MoeA, partial [Bacteriovoracaceae bacterium]|nr:molybdopterin molybdotransferase MoeA [Bacteriovoracaceae bacterium]